MTFSLPPNSASPDPNVADPVLAELRAECDRAPTDVSRGLLLHEIGVLEDATQNEGQAARDLLSAVNSLPDFHEPLERLVALIERRKSYKNLGKLVDRLAKIAATPEESSRALVSVAAYREDHESDVEAARASLEAATQARPDDVDAWLFLERLAAKAGLANDRRRALAARAELTTHREWQALLFIDVARLDLGLGELEPALAAIERALAVKGAATFAALTELARIGGRAERPDLVARALEERAALALRAIAGEPDDDAAGVPADARANAFVAADLLEAAELREKSGDRERAAAHLAKIGELVPDDPVAFSVRLRAAERDGDVVRAAELAKGELARGVHGSAAAALFMRVSEAAASSGDVKGALEALASALAEDPACLPARALELHLLGGTADAGALAQALESAASHLGSDPLAAELFLLSADTAVRGANDTLTAKAALSQAAASGAPLEVVARTGRMLAALANDAAWFEESTRRLLSTNPPEAERPALWFELARSRLLRGEPVAAAEALIALSATPGGAWLGAALRAYGLPRAIADLAPNAIGAKALVELADSTADAKRSRAFRTAAALRFRLSGLPDEALIDLRRLHGDEPSELVAATALATALRKRDEPLAAADALVESALGESDPAVAAALHLEAGILQWRAGARDRAIDVFESASHLSPEASAGLYAWALRAGQPNDPEARRRALEAAAASEDVGELALEKFALDVGAGDRATAATVLADATGSGVVESALELGRALVASSLPSATRETAFTAIALRGERALAVARSAEYMAELGSSTPTVGAREPLAAKWAQADKTLAPALEWLGQAMASKALEREIDAREELANRLAAPVSGAVLASARLLAHIAHPEADEPLLTAGTPEAALANLELSPPSCEPNRRAKALEAAGDVLDDASRACGVGLAGFSLLAAGDSTAAIEAFHRYVAAYPEDIVGWEGLRAAAELSNDKRLLAESSAALGDLVSDAGQGSELWERAATLLLDSLGEAAQGEAALSRAVERDITRKSSFDRLFRLVRARRDGPRLLELVSARLAVAEDAAEIAKLYWERARVLREGGNSRAALEALDNVTMLEPDHVGALALTGEIYISEKRFDEAAEALARLSELPEAPTQQRLMSGVAAVDLYENRLGKLDKALEVLLTLHRSGLSTLPVRERLARAAARSESWEAATAVLEELMEQRDTREGRAEAARLAMVLYRDKLGAAARAEHAALRLLSEVPDDGEAIDLALTSVFSADGTRRALTTGRDATIATLIEEPLDLERTNRLAEIARTLKDVQMRQVALGAVVALGGKTPEVLAELSQLDARIARVPQTAIDDRVVAKLRDPGDKGPIPELMAQLAQTIAEAIGPGLVALGVSKKERVRPQDGLPIRNEVAAWAGALGLGEFDLYVGGRDRNGIYAVATEVPSVVVGADVNPPLSAVHRGNLARELLSLKLGTTVLLRRSANDIAALVTAACQLGGAPLSAPPYAMLAEFERLLGKEMQRRVRKVLPELAAAVANEGGDATEWVRAAMSTLDRMAAAAIGDVSWVLAGPNGSGRGDAPETAEGKLRAERILSFILSPAAFAVRDGLGLGVR
ncbi:MAG TPA: tetratricopeptide repeat protein [Polyangiaceae bacterium]|nr:tetratricopeptide repeat protein [Polyangiaceae bacterium]